MTFGSERTDGERPDDTVDRDARHAVFVNQLDSDVQVSLLTKAYDLGTHAPIPANAKAPHTAPLSASESVCPRATSKNAGGIRAAGTARASTNAAVSPAVKSSAVGGCQVPPAVSRTVRERRKKHRQARRRLPSGTSERASAVVRVPRRIFLYRFVPRRDIPTE